MQKLPASTVKLITSTQVITSIYSVVKELVENSLDAGADSIEIRLEKGGLEKIEVIDNGSGISTTDINFLCKPHYTSKIRNDSDLLELVSYGFRGEAIYSLCSVSDFAVTTKTKNDNVSKFYTFNKMGDISEQKPTHHNIGTIVSVSKIFKDVPVRRQIYKQKKLKEELTQIEVLLMGYGLSHPRIRLILSNDKNIIWRKNRNSEYVYNYALSEVLGSNVSDNLAELNIEEEDFEVKLFIPKVNCDVDAVTRSQPDRFFMFVNERPVILPEMKSLLKKFLNAKYSIACGRWPICVVYIKVKPHLVDVNLEPNKTRILLLNMDEILEKSQLALDSLNELEGEGDIRSPKYASDFKITQENFEQDNVLLKNSPEVLKIQSTQVLVDDFFSETFEANNSRTNINDANDIESSHVIDNVEVQRNMHSPRTKNMVNHFEPSDGNDNVKSDSLKSSKKSLNIEDWSKGNVVSLDVCTPVRIHRPLEKNEKTLNSSMQSNIENFFSETFEDNVIPMTNEIVTPSKESQSFLVYDNHAKKRKSEKEIVAAKKHRNNLQLKQHVIDKKNWLKSGVVCGEKVCNTENMCDFSLDKIKKQFKSMNKRELMEKDIHVVGKLKEELTSTLWFFIISKKLFLIDNTRLIEKLLFEKMLKSHTFKAQKLVSSIFLSEHNLGVENYQCLFRIKELNNDGLQKSISHPHLTYNGLLIIRLRNSDDESETLVWTHGPSNIPNFDHHDLKEVIQHLNKNSGPFRPEKIKIWLKTEAKRLSQETTDCFADELKENIRELKVKHENFEVQSCVHGNPIMLQIKDLR